MMDQLHEELKEPMTEPYEHSITATIDGNPEEDNHSQPDDFLSCESCDSSERADSEVHVGNMLIDDTNEAEMLIPEQDEIPATQEWQKEKNMINDLYRSSIQSVMGGGTGVDMDKDVDTTTETTPIISYQGAIKVQGRASGNYGEVSPFTLHEGCFWHCERIVTAFRFRNERHISLRWQYESRLLNDPMSLAYQPDRF